MKTIFYLCLVGLLAFSCKKEEQKPTPASTGAETNPDNLFIYAKIDGTGWNAVNTANGCFYNTDNAVVFNSASGQMNMDYIGFFTQTGVTDPTDMINGSLQVKMSNFTHNTQQYNGSDSYFNNSFPIGAQNYFREGTTASGAEIAYIDSDDQLWSSSFGNQSGAAFNFTSVIKKTLGNTKINECRGNFSCKIYKETDPSQSKTITKGSFYVVFEKN